MIRFDIFPTFILISLLFLSGCFDNKNAKLEKQINELNQRVLADEKRIDTIEKDNFDHLRQLTKIWGQLGDMWDQIGRYDKVVLHPSEKGYQRIDTSSGFFVISVEDVKPYLDGFKLFLDIGNPSSATYNGFTLNVKWGRRFEGDLLQKIEWEKSLQTKEESFTEELKPASWTKVQLTISPATPEQLGSIELSMETPTIGLLKSRR